MSYSELRSNLAGALDQAANGTTVSVTRHGRPIADIVPHRPARTSRTERLWAMVDKLDEQEKNAQGLPLPEISWPPGRAEELVRQIRADRDDLS